MAATNTEVSVARPSTKKLVQLVALAFVELVAAWFLAQALIRIGRSFPATSADEAAASSSVPGPLHSGRSMTHSMGITSTPVDSPVMAWIFLSVACGTGIAVWLGRRRAAGNEILDVVQILAAAGSLGVLLLPDVQNVVGMSHLAMMIQVMIVMVIAPALCALVIRRHIELPSALPRYAAIPASLAYASTMVAWHVPSSVFGIADRDGTILTGVSFVVALALWVGVLSDSDRSHRNFRKAAVYIAGIPAGLIGLALTISTTPIAGLHDHATGALGALNDQRAGGVLMMIVEGVFFLPILMQASVPDAALASSCNAERT